MHFVIAKVVREFQPLTVIFDLSDLRYVSGGTICGIVMPLLKKGKRFALIPNCVVAHDATAEALAPLMEPNSLQGLAGSHTFANVNEALQHLVTELDLQQPTS